jgi:eukaryotic-like serine/threonine-protein kinase
MKPEQWPKIEELYYSALEHESSERDAFLKQACAGDEELFREIRSLLEHEKKIGTFMEHPAMDVVGEALAKREAQLRRAGEQRHSLVGRTVSHFRVVERLGGGGMGVVYKAEDTRLRRLVALKFLPRELEDDPQAFERLRREAQAASGLNHPNICTIYDIGETAGQPFIAMELLDGQTLKQRINAAGMREPPLRLDMLIDVAIQVSDALDAAHSQGIIHRDIKPENIFITQRGQAKVLDFGIAKQLPRRAAYYREALTERVTNESLTTPGVVMGTVSYMSPEQARGERLDARTDLFSFGAVLFETATGRQPFVGETTAIVFDAILNREPVAPTVHNAQIPQKLEEIIQKALEKDPRLRYQNASDLRTDLLRLKRETDSGRQVYRASSLAGGGAPLVAGSSSTSRATAAPPPATADTALIAKVLRKHSRAISIVAAMTIFLIAGGGYAIYEFARPRPRPRETAMKITQLTHDANARAPVISPDGKYVVYLQEKDHQEGLWLYQVATGSNVEIVPRVTTGAIPPTFSKDGNYIYYVDRDKDYPNGVLCKVPSLGGQPRKLFGNLSSAVTFSPDGMQLAFLRRSDEESHLIVANEDGSAAKPIYVVHAPRILFNNPGWSPDGKTIAVPRQTPSPQERRLVAVSVPGGVANPIGPHLWLRIFRSAWLPDNTGLIVVASDVDSQDKSQIYELSYPDGKVRRITFDLYDYNGLGLTADGNSLVSVKNETHSSLWVGSKRKGQTIAASVQPEVGGAAGLDWTPDGRIIYTTFRAAEGDLAIMDANGSRRRSITDLGAPGEFIVEPSVCGDGRHVIAVSNRAVLNQGGNPGLWKIDADGTNLVQLTRGTFDTSPSCSPDGTWVVFQSYRTGKPTIWKIAVSGGEQKQLTAEECSGPAVSPDGTQIACLYAPSDNGAEKLAIVPATGGKPGKTFDLRGTTSRVGWTPDAQNVTYVVSDVVADNLWEQPMRGGAPRRITDFETGGGILTFAWSRDGNRLAVVRGSRSQDIVLITNFRGKE